MLLLTVSVAVGWGALAALLLAFWSRMYKRLGKTSGE
jgi:hypothetical protein